MSARVGIAAAVTTIALATMLLSDPTLWHWLCTSWWWHQ